MKHYDPNKTLEWIREFMTDRGYAPSQREIRQGCHLTTTSVVSGQLNKLQTAGYIQWTPGVARSIVLLNGNGHYEKPLIEWRKDVMGDPPDSLVEYQEMIVGDWSCVVHPQSDGRWYAYVEESGQLPTVFGDGQADSEIEAKKLALKLLIGRLKIWLEKAERTSEAL